MSGDVNTQLGVLATRNNAVAGTASQGVYGMIIGLMMMLVMTPDGIVVYEFTADLMRDEAGNLTGAEHAIALITAVATMVTVALVIHWAYIRLSALVTNKIYLWMGLAALIIVVAQPLLVVLRDADLGGNSLDLDSTDRSFSGWVLFAATLARVGVFPLYAIVGTIGLGKLIAGWETWRAAQAAKGDSKVQHGTMKEYREGTRIAKMVGPSIEKQARTMRLEVVDLLNTAAMEMVLQYQTYLAGSPSMISRASFIQHVDRMIHAGTSAENKALGQIVKLHLPEVLPLNVLPVDGRKLPAVARSEIQTYINWIRENYNRKTLLGAIQ